MINFQKLFYVIPVCIIVYSLISYSSGEISLKSLSCNFENGLCGSWKIVNKNNVKTSGWYLTNSRKIEPGADHTGEIIPKPPKFGTWLTSYHQNEQNYTKIDQDIFQSNQPIQKYPESSCFTFWYYFYGFLEAELSVHFIDSATMLSREEIWSETMPKERNWIQVSLDLPPLTTLNYISFVAKTSGSVVMGLDDISWHNESCPQVAQFCDFEQDFCAWNSVGEGMHRLIGYDHTLDTEFGHFVEPNAVDYESISGLQLQIKSLPFHLDNDPTANVFCFSFYVYALVKKVHNETEKAKILISLQNENMHTSKTLQTYTLEELHDKFDADSRWQELRVNFEPSHSSDYLELDVQQSKKIITLDDFRILPHRCQVFGDCDFEDGLCGWSNDYGTSSVKNYLWIRVQPRNHYLGGRQMAYDATTHLPTGNYLIEPLEALKISEEGTRLCSPPITRVSDTICFRMSYFALATNASDPVLLLEMLNLVNDDTQAEGRVYPSTKLLGWLDYKWEVRHVPPAFKIIVHNKNSHLLISDIGIDDIKILPGRCGNGGPETTTPEPKSEKVLDCNFEDVDLCHWKFDKTGWFVTNFQNRGSHLAPRYDHTTGLNTGHYLLANDTSKLSLESDSIPYNKWHCFHLWYYYDSETPVNFAITIVANHDYQLHFDYITTLECRTWQMIRTDIPFYPGAFPYQHPNFKFKIGVSSQFPNFTLALDDITLKPGSCEHSYDYTYTFENELVDLKTETVQPLNDLTLHVITADDEFKYYPHYDHTTRSSGGHYLLFTENAYPTTYIDTLTMNDLPKEIRHSCVRFAYQSNGTVQLEVFAEPVDDYQQNYPPLWTLQFNRHNWVMIEFNKRVAYEHKLVFRFTRPLDNTSYVYSETNWVAIDDLTVLSHRCELPIDCDFEANRYCSYTPYDDISHQDHLEPRFEVYDTPSLDSKFPGPKYDHTTGNTGGGYLMLSSYHAVKMTDRIKSSFISGPREINPKLSYCLTLYTKIHGEDAELIVSLLRYGPNWNNQNRTYLLINLANQKQFYWTQLTFTLEPRKLAGARELQLILQGELTKGYKSKSVIAIDDISLSTGGCITGEIICEETGKRVLQAQICDFIRDCPSGIDEFDCGNCDFESGQCGWDNHGEDLWERVAVSFALSHYPSAPHTDGDESSSGYFMLMRPDSWGNPQKLVLHEQKPGLYLKHSFHTCQVVFDYFINVTSSFYLQVQIGYTDQDTTHSIYSLFGETPLGWHQAWAQVGLQLSRFFVQFVAFQQSPGGAVAIDNINFQYCATPTPTRCPVLKCPKTGICITRDNLCNGQDDCGDHWDESQCSKYYPICSMKAVSPFLPCNFTTDKTTKVNSVIWTATTGHNFYTASSPGYEPSIDNTDKTPYGSYFLLKPRSYNQNSTQTATGTFYTPMLISVNSSLACKIRFFYYFHSGYKVQNQLHLNVYIRYASKSTHEPWSLVQLSGLLVRQQQWLNKVTGFNSTEPFQFVFQGTIVPSLSRIAVDDVSYGEYCQLYKAPRVTTTTTTKSTPSTITPSTHTSTPSASTPPTSTPIRTPSTHIFTLSTTASTSISTPKSTSTVTNPYTLRTTTRRMHKNTKPSNSYGGKIVAGILIPLFVIILSIGTFYGYRQFKRQHLSTQISTAAIVMSNLPQYQSNQLIRPQN